MMKKPKTIKLLKQVAVAVAIALLPCRAIAGAPAEVLEIVESDTVTLIPKLNNEERREWTGRLVCIDGPESNQAWGNEAKARLRQLIPPGTDVIMLSMKGGLRISIQGGAHNISYQMVEEGYAVVDPQYVNNDSCDKLLEAQTRARQQNLNFWSQPNPCMPWDFRNNRCGDRESELW